MSTTPELYSPDRYPYGVVFEKRLPVTRVWVTDMVPMATLAGARDGAEVLTCKPRPNVRNVRIVNRRVAR